MSALEARVARHYDTLDGVYRAVWGEHVHHGLWPGGDPAALARLVADRAAIGPGAQVVDVGCGYGATARLLARERGAQVVGFTLSGAQAAAAARIPVPGVEVRVRSWLDNGLAGASCDAAIAIESLSHMRDHARAFAELGRVVRPGGRVVIVDWFAGSRRGPRAHALFAEPIAREGHLPALPAPDEYLARLRAAGFAVLGWDDLSDRVWRTWLVVARRLALLVARDRRARDVVLDRGHPERPFARSLARIPLAYRVGALRLGIIVAGRGAP